MYTEPDFEQIAAEARAEIIWGKSPNEVREWLADRAMPSAEIEAIISDCMSERAVEFRKRGLIETVIGGIITAVTAVALAVLFLGDYAHGYFSSRLAGLLFLAGTYGLYRLTRGIWWLVAGSKSEGSLANL